ADASGDGQPAVAEAEVVEHEGADLGDRPSRVPLGECRSAFPKYTSASAGSSPTAVGRTRT
ncbi:hypothetical protein, partial [Streptomyces albidoflavus]|uniref:hypothetical protein n=1 Tax=Streptomyces albidoflavus TaxID=1886 RepID=UPI00332C41C7